MLNSFVNDIKGNVAATLAVMMMMILAGVGAAVDLTSIQTKKNRYQNLADVAVLAAARSGETKKSELIKIAKKVVNANNNTGDTLGVNIKLGKDGRVQVLISGKHDAYVMGLFGQPNSDINVLAEAPLSISDPANIVLVLDTTGSMGGSKMTTLKSAASNLVNTMKGYENENLRISVIPFAEYVNVGLSRRGEPWLDIADDTTTPNPDNCYFPVVGQENCRMEPYPATPYQPAVPARTCYNDGRPYSCGGRPAVPARPAGVAQVCDPIYSTTQTCDPVSPTTSNWRGCVGSRNSPHNTRARYGSAKIPGLQDIHCGEEILPLTHTLATVDAKIQGLNAQGRTYIPAGLIWGWRALTRQQPLIEAKAKYKKNTRSIMILMTDGDNTLSANGALHDGADTVAANNLTKTLCAKIKQDKIEVYTIAYEITDMNTKSIIRNCASDADHYFDASSSEKLTKAFEDIGQSLLKLRITH